MKVKCNHDERLAIFCLREGEDGGPCEHMDVHDHLGMCLYPCQPFLDLCDDLSMAVPRCQKVEEE